jgi:hypothetical protein
MHHGFTTLDEIMRFCQGCCMRSIKKLLSFCLMGLVSTAAEATGPGAYVGLQFGQTKLDNDPYIVATGAVPPFAVAEPTNTGIGERLFFGIQMNRYAGFEMGLTNYAPSVYDPDVPNSNQPAIRVYSFDIVGKGMYSLSSFTLFGKLGGAGVRQTISGALADVPLNQLSKASNSGHVMAAVGVSFDLNPSWVLDITASRIFKGSNFAQADFYGLGISYHWVDLYCGQFLC